MTAETSSYMPPMMATCPGLLSVGTCVCDTPKAPLFSATFLRYGAIISGESGIEGKGLRLNNKSERSPSPEVASKLVVFSS